MKRISIINGPNLNLLGKREPKIYGNQSFKEYFKELKQQYSNVELHYFQSNHEGAIIDELHRIGFDFDGIILNAAALTHYSYSIADAIQAIKTPVVEVHISNIYEREDFRKISLIKSHCIHQIYGKGLQGYAKAVEYLINF